MMGCRGLQGKQEIRVPAPSVTASRPRTLGTFSSFWSTTPAPAVPDAPAANDALATDTEEMRVPLPANHTHAPDHHSDLYGSQAVLTALKCAACKILSCCG